MRWRGSSMAWRWSSQGWSGLRSGVQAPQPKPRPGLPYGPASARRSEQVPGAAGQRSDGASSTTTASENLPGPGPLRRPLPWLALPGHPWPPSPWGSITMSRPPACNVMAGPVAVMARGDAEDMDMAGADLDDEEHVQAAQGDGAVHVEEVACKRSNVSGVTIRLVRNDLGSSRARLPCTAQSARSSLGLGFCRRSTAISWRSTSN